MNAPGLRYAALRLANLHPRDREWLLQRLPAAVRDACQALIRTPGWQARAREAVTLPAPVLAVASHPVETFVESVAPPVVEVPSMPSWPALADAQKHAPLPAGLAAALASWAPEGEAAA